MKRLCLVDAGAEARGLLRGWLAMVALFSAGCGVAPPPDENASTGALEESAASTRLELDLEAAAPCAPNAPESSLCSNRPRRPHPQNAYWLARLSQLAYDASDLPVGASADAHRRAELERLLGAPANEYRFFEAEGMQAFYVSTPRFAVVSFRGTEPRAWDDIRADLRFLSRGAWTGRVHSGFADAANALWDGAGLRAFLAVRHSHRHERDYGKDRSGDPLAKPLFFTGHSLGGAMATVAAAHALLDGCRELERAIDGDPSLSAEAKARAFDAPEFLACKNDVIPVRALYTYGSPRVGDRTFGEWFGSEALGRGLVVQRVVNHQDIVARLPVSIGLGFFNHVGLSTWGDQSESAFLALLDEQGELRFGRGVEQGTGRAVSDHFIAGYVAKLARLSRRTGP